MDKRLELHEILCDILGSRNVYYQPPASLEMSYPAIVYSRDIIHNKHANNAVYNQAFGYQVILIDPDPDSEIVYKLSKLPMCEFNSHYTSNNLNHDIFTLYY